MKKMLRNRMIRCVVIFILTMTILLAYGWLESWKNRAFEAVNVVSEKVLIPGGQSVGIRMEVRGVLVAGLEELETAEGVVSPGYLAGLQIGDMISSINGTPVYNAKDVSRIVNSGSKALDLEVLRNNETLKITVQPVRVLGDETYKIGVWVKEKIAGIGTLTFYDPETNSYAALGHGIYESQTGTLLEVGSGEMLRTEVKSIQEGEAGKPGEIRGIFYSNENAIANVKLNSRFGIYASGDPFSEIKNAQPMIMARQSQIEEGDAQILTTINGTRVESFDIRIDKVNPQKTAGSKGIELTVTDERLLSYCGGIVQGMGVIDNRDNTEKPGNTGFFAVTLSNDPTTGV